MSWPSQVCLAGIKPLGLNAVLRSFMVVAFCGWLGLPVGAVLQATRDNPTSPNKLALCCKNVRRPVMLGECEGFVN